MAFPASKRRYATGVSTNINIIPVMNLFTSLIPFLLLCAVFASTAVLELSLPPAQEEGVGLNGGTEETESLTLTIAVMKDGFRIGGTGTILPLIPKKDNNYNYESLKEQLKKIKQTFPTQEDIIILSEPQIVYDLVIQVMDICTAAGFPNIALSGSVR